MQAAPEGKIDEALAEVSKDGRVACRQALALAKRLGVEPRAIGRAANRLRVKISACQLGCF